MKRSTLPLTILLPALCAAVSAAQMTPVRFAAPVNPISGLPRILPSPLTGPLAGNGISLPNLVPALTPSASLAAAAPLVVLDLPVSMPARGGQLPAASNLPGAADPLRRVTPGMVMRFNGPSAPQSGISKEKLDRAFDGEGDASKPGVNVPRQPISSGRHISLPEWDLERELGI